MLIKVKPERILCHSCIERQVESPNESVGVFQNLPYCGACMEPLIDNYIATNNVSLEDEPAEESKIELALKQFAEFEALAEGFALTKDETLRSHDDFFNYKANAIVNMTIEELESRIDKFQAVLFATKKHVEKIQEAIDRVKAKSRAEIRGLQVNKSLKESSKVVVEKAQDKKLESLAKALGISVAQLRKQMGIARQEEFKGVLEGKPQRKEVTKEAEGPSAKKVLNELKAKILQQHEDKLPLMPPSTTSAARCPICSKRSCICPKRG